MSKKTKAKSHLSADEIRQKIKTTVGFWRVQKWLIVYNALNFPRSSEEIAKHLAVSTSLVHKTISEYNRYGPSAIETKGKGGRRNSNLTKDEERAFMQGFITQAQKGQIATANQIKEAYEEQVGKKVHKTTIYRLLDRNGWRKVVPLPYHPKKNKEEQETFKKTSIMR
jgi:transposase